MRVRRTTWCPTSAALAVCCRGCSTDSAALIIFDIGQKYSRVFSAGVQKVEAWQVYLDAAVEKRYRNPAGIEHAPVERLLERLV